MWRPNNFQWWLLVVVALLMVFVWPPTGRQESRGQVRELGCGPRDELPVLPDQLALGLGDDPDAVAAHDLQTQQYDALYLKGGWTRKRLELKVARDPFNPSTERQVLTGIGVLTAFVVWRIAAGSRQAPKSCATRPGVRSRPARAQV